MRANYLMVLVALFLSSCAGLNRMYPISTQNISTEVQLNRKNYKVIERVSGEATATYIFGIGGLKNKHLVEQAKDVMLYKAKLEGGARAVINMSTEVHDGLWTPFYFKRTVRVSGYLIEFTE